MATDRYGNPIVGVMDNSIHQRAIRDIGYRDYIPEPSGDGEARGYEGAQVGLGEGLAMGVDIGQKAMGFAGRSLGPTANIGIDVAEGVLQGKDVGTIGTKAGWGTAKAVGSAIGGLPGMGIKAGVSIAKAEDPAKAAIGLGVSTAGSFLGGAVAGPIGAIAGSILGDLAYGSTTEGMIGDVLDARSRERERDTAERMGFSRGQTSAMAGVDKSRAEYGAYGVDPGVSSKFGVGLSPGLSDVDPYGGISLGDIGSLGDDASGGDDGVGDAPGHDAGSGGARGGGDEGTSDPGGIGGY